MVAAAKTASTFLPFTLVHRTNSSTSNDLTAGWQIGSSVFNRRACSWHLPPGEMYCVSWYLKHARVPPITDVTVVVADELPVVVAVDDAVL